MDFAARPEFLQAVLTVLYMIIMLVVTYAEFDGLKLMPFIVMPGT